MFAQCRWWRQSGPLLAQKSTEALIIIKTRRSLTQAVVDAVRENHSYGTPEVRSRLELYSCCDYFERAIVLICI